MLRSLPRFATRGVVGATFSLACHHHTEWSVRDLLERGSCESKYAALGARVYYVRIGFSGHAFHSPKLLIRSSPYFHMTPLLTTPDIFSA